MAKYGSELPKGATLIGAGDTNYGAELPGGATLVSTQETAGDVAPHKTFGDVAKESGQSAFETLKNLGRVYPALETVANLVTSSYGVPASGLAGLLALPFGVESAKKAIAGTQKTLVYEPQTVSGEHLAGATAYPFEKLEEGAEAVSGPIAEAGYPKTATAVKTAITGAPILFGARKTLTGAAKGLDAQTRAVVKRGVEKAVKPSVAGKKTRSQAQAYFDKATTAVEEIILNKDKLDLRDATGAKSKGLPKTLDEFSQAVEQTKKNVFEEYDALAKEGGAAKTRRELKYPLKKESGESVVFEGGKPYLEKNAVMVDLNKTSKKLDPVISNKVLKDLSPETIEYANKRIESLKGRKDYTAVETQEAIQFLNQTLEKFYRDPSPQLKGQALVDAVIANDLRLQLDTAISKSTGKEYGALKKKYGALKTIEKDVNYRAIVDARKNNKGLLDFSDVFHGGHVISGMLKAEPTTAAVGITGKSIAGYYKMLNDPNKIVKTMFGDVEKLGKATSPGVTPAIIGATGAELTGQGEQ